MFTLILYIYIYNVCKSVYNINFVCVVCLKINFGYNLCVVSNVPRMHKHYVEWRHPLGAPAKICMIGIHLVKI